MSLTEKQLAFRRTGLTATDLVVLAGESPYGDTLYDVYAEKCAPVPTKRPSTEAMEWGNKIEPLIVSDIAERKEVCVLYPCDTAKSVDVPWALATVDARIVEAGNYFSTCVIHGHEADEKWLTSALIECKVVGHRKAYTWPEPGDGALPPDWVVVQATWQMFVTGVKKCTVAALLGTELRPYDVNYDEELGGNLMQIGEQFWADYIVPFKEKGIIKHPPVDGSEASREMLSRLWPRNRENMLPSTRDADILAMDYLKFRADEKAAKEQANLVAAKLEAIVKDSQGIDGGSWRLNWKSIAPSRVEAYDRAGYRRFDLKMKKEK